MQTFIQYEFITVVCCTILLVRCILFALGFIIYTEKGIKLWILRFINEKLLVGLSQGGLGSKDNIGRRNDVIWSPNKLWLSPKCTIINVIWHFTSIVDHLYSIVAPFVIIDLGLLWRDFNRNYDCIILWSCCDRTRIILWSYCDRTVIILWS